MRMLGVLGFAAFLMLLVAAWMLRGYHLDQHELLTIQDELKRRRTTFLFLGAEDSPHKKAKGE